MRAHEFIYESDDYPEYNQGNNYGLSEEDAEDIINIINDGENPSNFSDRYPGIEELLDDHAHLMGTGYWDAILETLRHIEDGGLEIDEGRRKKRRRARYAAYGPGPYGGYGYYAGYSGDGGTGGEGGGGESIEQEGWKDIAAAGALATGLAFGSGNADAAKKPIEQPSITQQVSKKELSKTVTGNPHEVILKKTAERAGIKGQELVAFLSQCAHETMDFKHMKEIGGSLDFKKYDIRFAPNKAKALGNTKPGDGAKFKGRGYIQLTGKYNYKKAGDALGLDLVKNPQLVEKPEIAAKVAVWYWKNRVANKVDSFKDTGAVTKGINPGMKHLDQRKEKQKAFQVAMR